MKELFEKGKSKSKEMFRRKKESTCEIIKFIKKKLQVETDEIERNYVEDVNDHPIESCPIGLVIDFYDLLKMCTKNTNVDDETKRYSDDETEEEYIEEEDDIEEFTRFMNCVKTCLGDLQQEEMRKEDIFGVFQMPQKTKDKETIMEEKEPVKDPIEEKSMILSSNVYKEKEPTKQEERDELIDHVKDLPEEKIPVHPPLNSNITAEEQSTQE
jgi:hypothetical protein